jgi:hypothetical protein
MEMKMRTLRQAPTSSNRLRTAKPKKETLHEQLVQKSQARVEIWAILQTMLDRMKEQQEKAARLHKNLDMPVHSPRRQKIVSLLAENDEVFRMVEQHVAGLREYFSADEDLDRERDPKIEPVIANSIRAIREAARG